LTVGIFGAWRLIQISAKRGALLDTALDHLE